MATLNQMVNEVLTNLMSYGLVQPRITTLAADCDTDDTELSVANVSGFGPGQAEVGGERVIIQLVNQSASPITTPGTGTFTVSRGYQSDPVAHTAGELITLNPPWPRAQVINAINDAIVNAYPDLFAVHDVTFNSEVVKNTYDLDPLDVKILSVRTLDIGPSGEWLPLRNYRFDADLHKFTLYDAVVLNQSITVTTKRKLAAIGLTDDLTVSGLAGSAKRYVVQQATAYLVSNMDTARLPDYAAAPDMNSPRNVTAATTIAQQLYGLAAMEMDRERRRLQETYKPVVSFSGRGGFSRS